ncbi:MAG: hypothetical protein H6977_14135 [Gammaproteobacteria bacterium]|nr:hypothetical protein [Gammaproteobacteria bacterium]MCP5201147.1 hypothetical protein [Gammaproteobacteria bacterium]
MYVKGLMGACAAAVFGIASNGVAAASISTQGCLGTPAFTCQSDSEFANGPLGNTRVEHDGSLFPTSGEYTADVSGHADIAAGTLRSAGQVDSSPGDPASMGLDGGVIFGGSSIGDELTLTSTLPGSYDVTLTLTVNGSIGLDGGDGGAFVYLSLDAGDDSGSYTSDGVINDVLSVTQSFTGNAVFDIAAYIDYSVDMYPGDGANSDIALNGVLQLVLPEGVTFESESGAFLATPVPLPGMLPALAIALAGVGVVRRRL